MEEKESDSIVLYGGEPTLRNDLLGIITDARGKGYRRIKLITNGRSLSNIHYLQQVMNAGCSLFEITLWGSNPNLHDHLSGVNGSFWETMNGLENVSGVPYDKFVCIRVHICNENLPDLENSVITALNAGAHRIILSMQNRGLSFESVLPHISNSINISIFNRVWILTEGIPLCVMQGLEQHVGEIYSGWDTIVERHYVKNKQCVECIYDSLCPGTDVRSIAHFKNHGFSPVRAGKHFQDIKALYD